MLGEEGARQACQALVSLAGRLGLGAGLLAGMIVGLAEGAVIMADGKLISAEDLDLDLPQDPLHEALNLKGAREQVDRQVIRRALARTEGNISGSAKLLGVSRPTLYDLLKQYDLQN